MAGPETTPDATETSEPRRKDRTHFLYLAVIIAVGLGILVGLVWPEFALELKPLGEGFVNLIKMMISPIIFCTLVLGIGSIRSAAKVGKVGGLALGYFIGMSTVALAIGLVVGNILHPGSGLDLSDDLAGAGQEAAAAAGEGGTVEFILGIIPTTLVSALTSGIVLADPLGRAPGWLRAPGHGPSAASRSSAASVTCSDWSSAS